MRVLALLWIMKGLSAWAIILGIWTPIGHFESRSTGYQSTVIYFALIDLIAAVGLWMASTWGGIMWLLAVMSHLILAAFFPGIVSSGVVTMAAFLYAGRGLPCGRVAGRGARGQAPHAEVYPLVALKLHRRGVGCER